MSKHTNVTQLNLYLSRIGNMLHVGLDGNLIDLINFGIDKEKLTSISDQIEQIFQKEIGNVEAKTTE